MNRDDPSNYMLYGTVRATPTLFGVALAGVGAAHVARWFHQNGWRTFFCPSNAIDVPDLRTWKHSRYSGVWVVDLAGGNRLDDKEESCDP